MTNSDKNILFLDNAIELPYNKKARILKMFDMDMANDLATEMFEKQQLEEMDQFKEMESFAAKFSETWVITLPEDTKKVNTIISTQLAKKARRRA